MMILVVVILYLTLPFLIIGTVSISEQIRRIADALEKEHAK